MQIHVICFGKLLALVSEELYLSIGLNLVTFDVKRRAINLEQIIQLYVS